MKTPHRKKDYYPSAALAFTSIIGAFLCLAFSIAQLFVPVGWTQDFLFYGYFIFSGTAIILGVYSLSIQRSTRARIAVIGGIIFFLLYLLVQ